MDFLKLLGSIAVPWLLGVTLLRLMAKPVASGHSPGFQPWALGCGWFVGAFLLTLWMRVLSVADVKFSFIVVGLPLASVAVIATAWLWRRDGLPLRNDVVDFARSLSGSNLSCWKRVTWLALLAWVGLRFALLLLENVERPLSHYSYDAMIAWATKARVWFELKRIVPFVDTAHWLNAAPGTTVYTDTSPHYPGTVPLLQVWEALALGRWDDSLINLPWWFGGIALGLAIYGFLAQRGLSQLTALVGAWLVTSLPILDAHIALPGYADLPLAAYFALAGLALCRWLDSRTWDGGLLVVVLASACALIKVTGPAWVLVLLPAAVAGLVPQFGVRLALAGMGFAIVALMGLARTNFSFAGYTLTADFILPWQSLAVGYLLYDNFHLLWYGALGAALLGWRQLLSRENAPLTMLLCSSLLLLLLGFSITSARAYLEIQTTVNRGALVVAPLLVVWMIVVFEAWAARIPPSPAQRKAEVPRQAATPQFKRVEEARVALGTEGAVQTSLPDHEAVSSDATVAKPDIVSSNSEPAIAAATATADSMPSTPLDESGAPAEVASQRSPAPAANSIPTVGRNEPCPCGSGKRYKQCHGAVSQQVPASTSASDALPQEALFMRAIAAHQRGDLDAAERDYRAALAIAPDHAHASHYLGVVLYQRDRLDEALPLLFTAAERIPQEPEFHNNLGLALAAAERTDEAIDSYRRALALKPDHALAWNNLGLALQAKEDPAAAIEAYRSAISAAPRLAEAHNNLGNALRALERFDEALASYDRALAIDPRLPEAEVNRREVALLRSESTPPLSTGSA